VTLIRARRCRLAPRHRIDLWAEPVPPFAVIGGPNFVVLSGRGACWFALGLAVWNDQKTHEDVGWKHAWTNTNHPDPQAEPWHSCSSSDRVLRDGPTALVIDDGESLGLIRGGLGLRPVKVRRRQDDACRNQYDVLDHELSGHRK